MMRILSNFNKYLFASIILSTAYSPTVAQREEWVAVSKSSDGEIYYISAADDANNTNYYPRIWVRSISNNINVKWRESKVLENFNCRDKYYNTVTSVFYNENGSVYDSWDGKAYQKDYPPPGSVYYSVMRAACPPGSI